MAEPGETAEPEPDRGALLAEFRGDPHEQLVLARVRTVAGAVALVASAAALLGSLPVPALLVALLGLVMSLVWLRQARRIGRDARNEAPPSLRVHALGLLLTEGERTHWAAWSNVVSIGVDEERLDIVLQRSSGAPLRVEPRYPGVDLYELVRTLDDAWSSARRAGGPNSSQRA
jgi:hypothetical protein